MFEGKKKLSLKGKMELRLGAGIGVASGKLEDSYEDRTIFDPTYFGPTPDNLVQTDESKKWTGVTWEIGPALAYAGDRVDVEIGLVYSSFPKMKEDQNKSLAEFKWNPIGIRLGVAF